MVDDPGNIELCSRTWQAEQFIRHGKSMLCMWGREAMAKDRISFIDLAGAQGKRALQARIFFGMQDFVEKKKDVCIFIEETDPHEHKEGYKRAYTSFFPELAIACSRYKHEEMNLDPEGLRASAEHIAAEFAKDAHIPKQENGGLLQLKEGLLFWMCMNPLYSDMHPRHAPVTMHVVNRYDDVVRARDQNRRRVADMADRTFERTGSIYNVSLPYVMPDDPRCIHPTFAGTVELLRKGFGPKFAELLGIDAIAAAMNRGKILGLPDEEIHATAGKILGAALLKIEKDLGISIEELVRESKQ